MVSVKIFDIEKQLLICLILLGYNSFDILTY